MSGHNKWSKIKNKKAVTDAAKSKIFSKIVRLIAVESKKAKGDITSPTLRAAIDKAKAVNMPGDNIDRAVKKGISGEGNQMENITYEGYGPAGVGIIVEVLTDNRNKAAQEIKHIFSKNGAVLGTPGSVVWSFQKVEGEWTPTMTIPISDEDGEKLEKIVDALEENDDVQDVYTNAE